MQGTTTLNDTHDLKSGRQVTVWYYSFDSPSYTRVSQMKTLNMFYLVIYWTQKVHNDFILLCSIVLPPVGHSSNHEYHCSDLRNNRAVVRIFIALLRFSVVPRVDIYTNVQALYLISNIILLLWIHMIFVWKQIRNVSHRTGTVQSILLSS